MKNHAQSVIVDIFGIGFSSIVMGSSIFIWRCTPVEVTINGDLEDDYEDIPIRYLVGTETVTGFVDVGNYQIKNSSKMIPGNIFKVKNLT